MTVYSIFAMVAVVAFVLAAVRFFVKRPPNILITFVQDFVGALFIFSGFVKAVDPLGTGYKMHEYFEAFAGEGFRPFWEYLAGFSTFMAVVMIALELFVGLMLIIGWRPRLTVGIVWLLTLFFTFLTGYTYLSGYGITKLFIVLSAGLAVLLGSVTFPQKQSKRVNLFFLSIGVMAVLFLVGKYSGYFFTVEFTESKMKVTDCGCFGDFIKLKPWETFYKDVVLDVLILLLVLNVKFVRPVFNDTARTGLALFGGSFALLFCLYNVYLNEPVIDFRPYKIGSDINEMRREKKPAVIEMIFLYKDKATGKIGEYSQKDFGTMNFDALEYVDRKDKVLDPGIPAKITNLRIENDEGADITDTLLHDPAYTLMVVSYNLNKTHTEAFEQLNAIAAGCDKAGIKFYAVTVNDGHVDEFRHAHQTAYPFYHADETPLKTMIRSNPGLILFKNGVVINKWHYRHLPTFESLNSNYFSRK